MVSANPSCVQSSNNVSELDWFMDLRLRADIDAVRLFKALGNAGFNVERTSDGRWGVVPAQLSANPAAANREGA